MNKKVLYIIFITIFTSYILNGEYINYKVKKGDTLFDIAFKYNMNVGNFLKINKIKEYKKYNLHVGTILKVVDNRSTVSYKVKNGDTLLGIAYRHDMKSSELYKLNKIDSKYLLKIGDTLKVYKKNNTPQKIKAVKETYTPNTIRYKVKNGDTLSQIALDHDMDLIDIYSINNLNSKYLLKIADTLKVYKKNINIKKVVAIYIAKNGDNLYSIAKKNNMTFNELARLNNMKNANAYKLKIGEKLRVNKTVIISQNKTKREAVNNTLPKSSFIWPYRGSIIAEYGVRSDRTANRGISISAKIGSKVLASDDGIIEYASNIRGFGNVIIIKHGNNYTTSYAHLSNINVKLGEKIKKGKIIGIVGDTGFIDDHQLYFRISYKGRPINPMRLLPKG